MDKTKLLVVLAIVASLVLSLVAVFQPTPVQQVVREIREQLGAIPGDSVDEKFCIGGVCTYGRSGACGNATDTFFAIQNPARATSTWTSGFLDVIGAATSGPYFLSMSTSTSAGRPASSTIGLIISTLYNAGDLGAVKSGTLVGTSTPTRINQSNLSYLGLGRGPGTTTREILIGPDEYIVGYATGSVDAIVGGTNDFACNWAFKVER